MGQALSVGSMNEAEWTKFKTSALKKFGECWECLKGVGGTLAPWIDKLLHIGGGSGLLFFRFYEYLFKSWAQPLHHKFLKLFQSWTSAFLAPTTSRKVAIALEIVIGAALVLYINGPAWVLIQLPLELWHALLWVVSVPLPTSLSIDGILGPLIHLMATKIAPASFLIYHYGFARAREIRVQEEAFSASRADGWKPIYASQYASLGGLNHQILIVDDQKYELRMNERGEPYYFTTSCPINHSNLVLARDRGEASMDRYYVYRIGWTRKTRADINTVCDQKIQGWRYDITDNNCQKYIRTVADEIVEDKSAADWEYFRHGKKTFYQHYLFTRPLTNAPLHVLDRFMAVGVPGYAGLRMWMRD